MPTLRDVAERAGVALSTASVALKGGEGVSEVTRRRVLAAADAVGYAVRHKGAAGAPGVMLAAAEAGLGPSHFTLEVLHAVRAAFRRRGIPALALIDTHLAGTQPTDRQPASSTQPTDREPTSRKLSTNRTLSAGAQARGVPPIADEHAQHGLLLIGGGFSAEFLARVAGSGVPAVLAGSPSEADELDAVTPDYQRATYTAARHLIELGHCRLAFVGMARTTLTRRPKLAGYRLALGESGLFESFDRMIEIDPSDPVGTAERLRGSVAPAGEATALVCDQDRVAIAVIHALQRLGVAVPAQVSVTGVHDTHALRALVHPGLTTIDTDPARVGLMAVERLWDLQVRRLERTFDHDPASTGAHDSAAKGNPEPARAAHSGGVTITVPTHLVVRESTSRVPR